MSYVAVLIVWLVWVLMHLAMLNMRINAWGTRRIGNRVFEFKVGFWMGLFAIGCGVLLVEYFIPTMRAETYRMHTWSHYLKMVAVTLGLFICSVYTLGGGLLHIGSMFFSWASRD